MTEPMDEDEEIAEEEMEVTEEEMPSDEAWTIVATQTGATVQATASTTLSEPHWQVTIVENPGACSIDGIRSHSGLC